MKLKTTLVILTLTLLITLAFGQESKAGENGKLENSNSIQEYRHSIGSSLFLLGNFGPGDPVYFFQLGYGHQLTPKDNLVIEAITWTYYEPLGTYGNSEEMYPGKVRAIGIGAGYQRFHWKKVFTTVEATPFLLQYFDEDDKEIQQGFQLYLQGILGYRLEFLKKRLFVEPAIALKYWPVNTNMPASFEEIEEGAPNTIIEPSCNFGVRF